jgi:hypothetical protein
VGDRNAGRIQGAVFAQGPGIHIDHCIFYDCKNAILSFVGVTDFALTHSIVYGAYEGAIWFGNATDVVFRNNILANNRCAWIRMPDATVAFPFEQAVITGNDGFIGINRDGVIVPDSTANPVLRDVQRSGKVTLQRVTTDTIPRNYLHPVPGTLGSALGAGLFGTR